MAFSTKEQEIIKFGAANNKTRREVEDALIRLRTGLGPTERPKVEEVLGGGFINAVKDIPSDFLDFGEEVVGTLERGRAKASEIVSRVEGGETTPAAGTLQTIGAGLRAGAETVGSVFLGLGKLFTSPKTEAKLKIKVEGIAKDIIENKSIQGAIDSFNKLDKETQRNVIGILGVAEGVLVSFGVGPVIRAVKTGTSVGTGVVGGAIKTSFSKTKNLVSKNTPRAIKDFHSRITTPATLQKQVDTLVSVYKKSFVADKTAANNKLDKLASVSTRSGNRFTKERLLDDLAKDGAVPRVEDKMGNFNGYLDEITDRKSQVMKALDPILARVRETTKLSDMETKANTMLQKSSTDTGITIESANKLEKIFRSLDADHPDGILSASDLHNVRVAMNSKTKFFREDVHQLDAQAALGNVIRDRLDIIAPQSRPTNLEWARLNTLSETALIFHNQPIDVGIFNDAIGRYTGAILIGATGIPIFGPGSLVIAGLAATLGGKYVANLIRKWRFNPEKFRLITQEIKRDKILVRELINDVEGSDRVLLERALLAPPTTQFLPEKTSSSIKKSLESETKVVPAEKGPVGVDPDTGKFKKTFKST